MKKKSQDVHSSHQMLYILISLHNSHIHFLPTQLLYYPFELHLVAYISDDQLFFILFKKNVLICFSIIYHYLCQCQI
jgi:hypothetical protein